MEKNQRQWIHEACTPWQPFPEIGVFIPWWIERSLRRRQFRVWNRIFAHFACQNYWSGALMNRHVTAFASTQSRLKPKMCVNGDFNGFSINQSDGISNWYPLDYAIEISCSYVRIGAHILSINWLMSTLINMPSETFETQIMRTSVK